MPRCENKPTKFTSPFQHYNKTVVNSLTKTTLNAVNIAIQICCENWSVVDDNYSNLLNRAINFISQRT